MLKATKASKDDSSVRLDNKNSQINITFIDYHTFLI